MRLLLVEDDAMIGETVLLLLRTEHYAVDWVRDGAMADQALRSAEYDLVLLDLGLPKRDGLEVLRALRSRRSSGTLAGASNCSPLPAMLAVNSVADTVVVCMPLIVQAYER